MESSHNPFGNCQHPQSRVLAAQDESREQGGLGGGHKAGEGESHQGRAQGRQRGARTGRAHEISTPEGSGHLATGPFFFFFFKWLYLQHVEVPGPGIKPEFLQQPKLDSFFFFFFFFFFFSFSS